MCHGGQGKGRQRGRVDGGWIFCFLIFNEAILVFP